MKKQRVEKVKPDSSLTLFRGSGGFTFDIDVAVEHLRNSDSALGRFVDTVGPCRMQLHETDSVFGSLAQAIVYQQLNGKAAETIFSRLRALFPNSDDAPTAQQLLSVSDEMLRSAGLSRSKLCPCVISHKKWLVA